MTQKESIRLFEERKVRAIWDDEQEEWYFSIVDVISILTDSPNPRKYWSVLKTRLKREGSELSTNCRQLKMQSADGKNYLTDVANTEQLFRLIQSVPSPKAEPFKLWIAQVAKERLDQMQDPELSIEQAMADYKRLGYSDNWINQRLKAIEVRKDLTDAWKKRGVQEGQQFATLTDIITNAWSGFTTREYKACKRSRVRASYSPPNKNRLKLMFEAVFCKRARVGLFFLDKQWTNKIAIYNDCKPLFSDSYKLCVDNFSVRIVVYDGLVARLDTLRSPKESEEPRIFDALHVGNPVAAYDVGLVAIIGENAAREIEPFVVMLGAPCRNLGGPVGCDLDKNGIAGLALQLVNGLLLYLGQLLQLLFLNAHVAD